MKASHHITIRPGAPFKGNESMTNILLHLFWWVLLITVISSNFPHFSYCKKSKRIFFFCFCCFFFFFLLQQLFCSGDGRYKLAPSLSTPYTCGCLCMSECLCMFVHACMCAPASQRYRKYHLSSYLKENKNYCQRPKNLSH